MQCPRCGAAVTVPDDLFVETTRCEYCGTVSPLPKELARARSVERQTRDRNAKAEAEARAHAAQASEESPLASVAKQATSMAGWVLAMGALGTLAVAGAIAFIVLRNAGSGSASASTAGTLSPMDEQANLALLVTKLTVLRNGGCKHVVVAPAAKSVGATLSLSMRADGNCTRLVMVSTAGATLGVDWKPPAAAAFQESAKGALEVEHCPTATGEHALTLIGPLSGYAYAVVDCAPAREKFAHDPEKNGSAAVSARLKTLRDAGCSRVLLAPEKLSGSRTITSTMQPGGFCAVLVAATGVPEAKLGLRASSPIGETLAELPAAPSVENVLCATTPGPHKIELTPTTPHYYTLAGIDCPRKVLQKIGREAKK